ncbi:MAG: transcription-repair coupling factor, partial [Candidatus Binatia bacterium]
MHVYPAWDAPPFEGLSPNNEILAAQIEGLYYLLSTKIPLIVTSVDALAQRVFPQEELIGATLSLKVNRDIPLSDLVDHLVQWGYRRVPLVEEKGEIGVRGGLVDLFPPLATQPLRIEFFGDTIESMRTFDPSSQRSVGETDEISLLPMRFFSSARLQAGRRGVEEALGDSEIPYREQQRISENLKSGLPFPGAEFL